MRVVLIILYALAGYFLLLFAGTRLVVPFMSFGGFKPPGQLPREMTDKIAELESSSQDQMAFLRSVYGLILEKTLRQYKHTRFKAGTRFFRAFVKDLGVMWNTNDFLYCTGINYLLYTMLIKSKFFRQEDIKVRHTFVNFFIHQYLRVKIGQSWVDVDPAGTGIRGKPLGEHLSFFG